ncbi:MAG: hypothetical protein KBT19_10125 [Lachnospiraceae bacterium]|nr:hypothetical protein [Candidatus Colinaster equi]
MDNNDYKHIVQDVTNIYLGGRLTYDEMMNAEDIPFKLKSIFAHYMLREVAGETSLENHLFHIEKNSMSYMVFKKMKAKFLLNVFYEDGHGKNKPGYHIDEFTIDDVIDNADIRANMNTIFLTEVRISKLKMMGVTI